MRGRRYAPAFSLQGVMSGIRTILMQWSDGRDEDIKNCHPNILNGLLQKVLAPTPCTGLKNSFPRFAEYMLDPAGFNREAEEAFIPFCQEQGIGILVRGPLSKGILSGRYDLETEFTDTVRSGWNKGKRTAGSTNRNSGSLHAFKPWWAMPI